MDANRAEHAAYRTTQDAALWALADAVVAIQEANARLARCFFSGWIGALRICTDANLAAGQILFGQAERQRWETLRA